MIMAQAALQLWACVTVQNHRTIYIVPLVDLSDTKARHI